MKTSIALRWFGSIDARSNSMKPLAALLSTLWIGATAHAATLVVDTTSALVLNACTTAPADCSLGGAIAKANAVSAFDTIAFNIPVSDPNCTPATEVCRISFTSAAALRSNNPLLIDGYTQPGSIANTIPAPGANNAQLKIELTAVDGDSAQFWFLPTNSTLTLRGLAIFLPGGSMVTSFGSGGFVIQGCWLGVQANGETPTYSLQSSPIQTGVGFGTNLVVGGPSPEHRNVLAGSGRTALNQVGGAGIELRTIADTNRATSLLFQGNLVGLGPDGITPLPFRDPLRITIETDGEAGIQVSQILENRFVRVARSFGGGFGDAVLLTPSGQASTATLIQRNIFGLAVDGTPIGVEGAAIRISAGNGAFIPNVLIGGPNVADANIFVGATNIPGASPGAAISWGFLPNDARVQIIGNRMMGNQNLGIDLPGPLGARTVNDAGDADTGANHLQNFPELSAFSVIGNQLNLDYRIDSSTINSVYPLRVDFYRAAGDEGEQLIATDSYTAAQAQSIKNFQLTIPAGLSFTQDDVLTAVATDAQGRSSEFSFQPLVLSIVGIAPSTCTGNVSIFCDGFDLAPLRSVKVTVRATSSIFKPNGVVLLTDSRGASCLATLRPNAATLTSEGDCILVNSGTPGARTVTAEYQTLTGAFGSATGGNITVTQNFTL